MSTNPGAYVMPDGGAVAPPGEAEAAELHALLREGSSLDPRAVIDKVSTDLEAVAEAAAGNVGALAATRHTRRLGFTALSFGGAIASIGATNVARMVERVAVGWSPAATPPAGSYLAASVIVTPANPTAPGSSWPPDWIIADQFATAPTAPGEIVTPGVVFDPANPYYVPAGMTLTVLTIGTPGIITAQWADVPATAG